VEMRTRHLQESDRSEWQELYYAYLAFYESEPIDEATNILWTRLTAESAEIQSSVIEIDGKLVGFVHYHFQLSSWSHSSHCYLEDLYVDERFRNRGIASALIEEVKRAALERQCSELFWITRSGNATARRLYDKVARQSDFVRYEILLENDK